MWSWTVILTGASAGPPAGHLDVGLRRGRVAARVVVDHDDRRGPELERALDHLARVEGRVVDRAAALDLVADQDVLAVEEQEPEMLGRLVAASPAWR